jgi:hypothetical protein
VTPNGCDSLTIDEMMAHFKEDPDMAYKALLLDFHYLQGMVDGLLKAVEVYEKPGKGGES